MRKVLSILVAIAVSAVTLSSVVLAGTTGSPFKGEHGWVGLEVDIINEKEMEADRARDAQMEGRWVFLEAGHNTGEGVELYVKLGLSELEGKWWNEPIAIILPHGGNIDVELDQGFAFAMGFGIDLWQHGGGETALRLGGEWRGTSADIEEIKVDAVLIGEHEGEAELSEWQVSLTLSEEFDRLTPYVGLRYSDSDLDWEDVTLYGTPLKVSSAENAENFGVFVGVNYLLADDLAVTLEGRFIDEKSVTIAGKVRW